MATAVGLVSHRSGGARLADGSVRQFDLYIGEVEWGGTWRSVLISGVGNEPLVGVKLLDGHTLRVVVTPGGVVEITPNP
jgi:predicted aspartyl protease